MKECTICGSEFFTTGPSGRLSFGGHLPQCQDCGSLERHRIIRAVWAKIPADYLSQKSALQFSYDTSVDGNWFSKFEVSVYGKENSLDIQDLDREKESYDIVICNHVLEHVEDDRKAFIELMRVLKPTGFLQISVPKPIEIDKTDEWGFPDEKLHGHYRHYGLDLIERFNLLCPHNYLIYTKSSDSITETDDYVFFWSKSQKTIGYLKDKFEEHFEVMS